MAKSLKRKKRGPIETGKFSVEESKTYLAAAIICFHIVPLFFVFMKDTGQQILEQVFLIILNSIFLFMICCFHSCRLGFCFKFPAITGGLAALSVAMYYDGIAPEMKLTTVFVMLIVYLVISFISELLGGFLKKLMGGY